MFDLNSILTEQELSSANQIGGADLAYKLLRTTVKENKKFHVKKTTFTYNLNNNAVRESLFAAEQNFKTFITEFSTQHILPLDDDVEIQIIITHTSFDCPINSNFIPKSQFSPDIISSLFHNVVQSRKKGDRMQLSDADEMTICLSVAQVMHGAGRVKRTAESLDELLLPNQKIGYKKAKILREI
jgi:hypothetical protein